MIAAAARVDGKVTLLRMAVATPRGAAMSGSALELPTDLQVANESKAAAQVVTHVVRWKIDRVHHGKEVNLRHIACERAPA